MSTSVNSFSANDLKSASEQMFISLTRSAPVGIFRTDVIGNCYYVNDRWCQIAGLTSEEAAGFGWVNGIYPSDRELVSAEWNASVEEKRPFSLEYRFQNKSGQITWAFGQAVSERNETGEIIGYIGTITDISDRKYAEEQAQHRLDILEAARDIIASIDFTGKVTYLNQAGRALLGIAPDEDVSQTYNTDYHSPEIADFILQEAIPQCIQNGFWAGETRFRRRDGSEFPVLQTIVCHRQKDGFISHFSTIARDISDRKQAEAALQQLNQELEIKVEERTAALKASEATNRATLEAIPDLLLRLRSDGTCLEYFRTGIRADNFLPVDRHISEVLPPELLQNQLQIIEQALLTKELQVYEHHFLKRDLMVYEEIRIVAINDQEVLAIVRDISDRKLSEEKLRKSDIHLKTAQRIGKLGSWEFDPYTDQIVWSDEVFQIFGRDPAMGTPSFEGLQEQIHPDDRAHHQQEVQTAIANIQSFDLGFRFFRSDGSVGYIQSRGEPIVNATGQLTQLIGTVLDITDRKQAEEALRESEELKKRILESSSDCIKLIDLDGRLQYMNAGGQCIMEIDDFSLFLNTDWVSLWPEASRLDMEAAIATAKTGQTGRFQGFCPTAKGTPKWWDVMITPILDESGQISQLLSVSRDISDRKQAEQEILEKQRFIQKIAEASPNILYLYDLQQHCNVYSNREIASVLGYTPTEIQAMGSAFFANLMHPEDIVKIPDYYQQIEADQEGGIFEIEYRMRHANGEWRWLYSRDTVFSRDNRGKIKLTIGTAQDISDRKQAEEQLKNLSNRLTLAIKSGNIGIWDWNVTENILTWDDRMYELYGISPDRFTSVYDAWASSLHPDDRTLTELAVQQALTGEKDYDPEFRIVHPDSTIRFIQGYAFVQRNDRGEAIRMIGMNIDITNQKRAEAKLRETSAQLSASNQELEAFAYSVSHDLRSPLRAIDGFSNALLGDYGDKFDADAKDYFDRIRSNVARMGTLIDDLLSLSRVSRSEIEYRNVNLSILVQEQLDELQTTDPHRQVEIAIAPNVWVSADSTLMRVVVSNLIQNAWKFTSHHATARIEFGMLASENQQENEQFTYFIRDNGAGFNMNYVKKLFGVFQRLHNTNEFAGTGIGLATVQRAIHRHGGRVWAEGDVEKGATIYFTLPNSSSQELK